MGTTAAVFHIAGTVLDRLKRSVMEGTMHKAIYLSILTEIPSGPELLSTLSEQIRLYTYSSEQRRAYNSFG